MPTKAERGKDKVIERLSALSLEFLQFGRGYKKRYDRLLEKFNELQAEILRERIEGKKKILARARRQNF